MAAYLEVGAVGITTKARARSAAPSNSPSFQEQSLQFFQVLAQEQNLSDAEQQSYAALQSQADSIIADNAGKLYADMTACSRRALLSR